MKKGIAALAADLRSGVLSVLLLFVWCMSCTDEAEDISGSYVHHTISNMSIASDTILIRRYNKGTYLIERRTGFNRIINGVLQTRVYKKENSVGVMDAGATQLTEQKHGRIYSVSSSMDELMIGNATYKKIK